MSAAPPSSLVYNLGPVAHIPEGEGRVFRLGEARVAVFRARSGELHATQAECPHRQGPLADGMLGNSVLVCPLHGFRFDLPTGRPLGNDCQALRTYPVELSESGDVLLRLVPS
jgi:nitrite reductase (NADH) small subunit